MEISKTIYVKICDNCGQEIIDYKYPWLVMHNMEDDVVFESKIFGDYCEDCMKLLSRGLSLSLNTIIGERYDTDESKCKDKELHLIKLADTDFNKF